MVRSGLHLQLTIELRDAEHPEAGQPNIPAATSCSPVVAVPGAGSALSAILTPGASVSMLLVEHR